MLNGKVLSKNNGTWYYDWTNKRARFDHGEGQTNNFCGGQGLSPKDPRAPCSLIFSPEENMYVFYPKSYTCCRLCGKEQGCTILKPDWIHKDSKLLYEEKINGDNCYGYGKKGAVTTYDVMFSDVSGYFCRYHEVVAEIVHNLTFYRESFNFDPLPDYLFEVPRWCNEICPHPYTPPPLH
ncbi:secreted protein [Elysia marginata]|uniref:Secreted protein n=1 Tax=Elysia marginata TaxID=1093978 RepID=A0AAV4HFU2_9GAST|nr:secreted protein [Elysia marginata]